MSLTVVKNVLDRAYFKEEASNSQKLHDQTRAQSDVRELSQAAGRAIASTGSLGSEAVITNIKGAYKQAPSTEKNDKLASYRDAENLSEEVADEIRESDTEEPVDAHRGMSGKSGYYA